jgi:hypothetical protein
LLSILKPWVLAPSVHKKKKNVTKHWTLCVCVCVCVCVCGTEVWTQVFGVVCSTLLSIKIFFSLNKSVEVSLCWPCRPQNPGSVHSPTWASGSWKLTAPIPPPTPLLWLFFDWTWSHL